MIQEPLAWSHQAILAWHLGTGLLGLSFGLFAVWYLDHLRTRCKN